MSKPDFLLCDICGAKVPESLTMFIPTDTHFDGLETVVDGKRIDLCHAHLHAMVKSVLKKGGAPDYELGTRLVKWYEKK